VLTGVIYNAFNKMGVLGFSKEVCRRMLLVVANWSWMDALFGPQGLCRLNEAGAVGWNG
jgi:hypothetical protein